VAPIAEYTSAQGSSATGLTAPGICDSNTLDCRRHVSFNECSFVISTSFIIHSSSTEKSFINLHHPIEFITIVLVKISGDQVVQECT
jgi:hypothetical protein